MNWIPKAQLKLDKINRTGVPDAPVLPVERFAAPRNSDARQRMLSRQPASGAANHARHHVSRRLQSWPTGPYLTSLPEPA